MKFNRDTSVVIMNASAVLIRMLVANGASNPSKIKYCDFLCMKNGVLYTQSDPDDSPFISPNSAIDQLKLQLEWEKETNISMYRKVEKGFKQESPQFHIFIGTNLLLCNRKVHTIGDFRDMLVKFKLALVSLKSTIHAKNEVSFKIDCTNFDEKEIYTLLTVLEERIQKSKDEREIKEMGSY